MRISKSLMLLVIMLTATFVWLIWENKATLYNKASLTKAASMQSEEQNKKTDDPCRFRNSEGLNSEDYEIFKKGRDRETFGYPADTPLSEAIKFFNQELQCSPLHREYLPLTEEEVIAAIVVSANDNKRGTTFLAERDAFWKIATQKMMPKGSILRATNGGNVQGSPLKPFNTIQAKGIEIFILLGADKNGREDFPAPAKLEEMLTIRKTFSGIEMVK